MHKILSLLLLVSLASALDAPQVSIEAQCDGYNTAVTLSWDDVTGAHGYNVFYKPNVNDEFTIIQAGAVSPYSLLLPTGWDWQTQNPHIASFYVSCFGDEPVSYQQIAFYPMNGSLDNIIDNDHDCIPHAVEYSTDRFNIENGALLLDGVNSYATMSTPITSPMITISAWFNISCENQLHDMTIVRHRTHGYNIMVRPVDGELRLFTDIFTGIGTNRIQYMSPFVIIENSWHNVTLTYDGFRARTYYDNELAYESISYDHYQPVFYGNGATAFGRDGDYPDRYFCGLIDDISYYNYALSQSEIIELIMN